MMPVLRFGTKNDNSTYLFEEIEYTNKIISGSGKPCFILNTIGFNEANFDARNGRVLVNGLS